MTLTTARMAWRNLWRNPRRTSLAVAAIGLSLALVLVYDGVLRAYADWMRATMTGPLLGHVQAHAPEWRKDRAMDRTLRDTAGALAAARRSPGVASASLRVYAPALAAVGEEGFAVLVLGVDPSAEAGPMGLLEGASARPAGQRALMGKALAETMGVSPGDVVAIVGQGADGSLANDLFTVAGLVSTSVDFVNRQAVLVDLPVAQELFAMPGEAHELVVHGAPGIAPRALAEELARLPELAGAEVLDWERLAPELVALVRVVEVAWAFVLVLVFAAAASGVANTMLMSTYERTHELGMLLALGARPRRIVSLVVAEAIVLGAVGVVAGVALGGGVVAVTHRTGFDFQALTGRGPRELSFAGLRWSLVLYPRLALEDVVRGAGAVLLTALLAAAWPASRAARLEPSKALRS